VTVTGDFDNRSVAKVYAAWARFAPIYDLVFGPVLAQGRKDSIAAAERVGGRILEVGIGTGISLIEYSGKHPVVGVDYSEPMIRKAQERTVERRLAHVEALAVMDGTQLAFASESFDAVLAQYVITTVPDPEGTLDEIVRVTRPGGEIILVNHLGAEAGLRRDFERSFAPMARKLGWQPEFSWARLARWAQANGGVRLIERRPMPPFGHFSMIRFARVEAAAQRPEPAMAGAAARA
jgi:phosphatidylethanolamine/phosphatidyl-N-methylethanolamine N-methyltransferase